LAEADATAPIIVPARNFRLKGARRLAPDWKTRAADNIAAIRLMLELEKEARNAAPEEQDRLALFASFGAGDLANNLFPRSPDEAFPKGWETLGEELEELVSPNELLSLARVTQYAHFTPEFMVRAIWRAVTRMGFSGGRVLEPGCGTGLFFALMPEALEAKTTLTGVEMDPITARIAKLLHPNAVVRAEDFTKARIAETYDLVIGNPPFSSRTVRADDLAGRLGLSLHDYFIARSIERLRPGGLAAFVTSRWTMDKADPTARTFLASMADLVGAVRLPEGAMRAAAGTDVVVDCLFFRKRLPDEPTQPVGWIELAEAIPAEDGEEALSINRYFVDRPNMVLGSHARSSSAYGPTYTCLPLRSEPDALFQNLLAAVHTLPAAIYTAPAAAKPERETLTDESIRVGTAAARRSRRAATSSSRTGSRRSSMAWPSPFRSAAARAPTASPRGMRASSGTSFRFATPFATFCECKNPISPGAARRSGCVRLMRISSGSSARST
jgi:adenine-specific DNA methylase